MHSPFRLALTGLASITLASTTLALALPASAAFAQSAREAIVPEGTEGSLDFGYSAAVRAGDFVYLSGVVAGVRLENGVMPELTPERMEQAFDRTFDRIGDILEASGASWDQVVDMTTYHTDMPSQIETFMAVKNRYVKAPYPAWTAIDIDRLYPDGGLVEVKVTAYAPKD